MGKFESSIKQLKNGFSCNNKVYFKKYNDENYTFFSYKQSLFWSPKNCLAKSPLKIVYQLFNNISCFSKLLQKVTLYDKVQSNYIQLLPSKVFMYLSCMILRASIRFIPHMLLRGESEFEIRTLSVIWTLTIYQSPHPLPSIRCGSAITL